MSLATLKSQLLAVSGFVGLRPASAAAGADEVAPALSGTNGGLLVEHPASTVATEAKQDDIITALGIPTTHTAITKSDATDLTSLANVGVIIGGAGDLAYRCTGNPSTTVTLTVVAGQFIPGQFTRVMAATTATNIVGVAR
jgi:hypothetical protein